MELFSAEFLSALLAIIIIDLVLAGDNAIVIALAARNLPEQLQQASDRVGHGRCDRGSHGDDPSRGLAAESAGSTGRRWCGLLYLDRLQELIIDKTEGDEAHKMKPSK